MGVCGARAIDLEVVVVIFGDRRLFLLDLLTTLTFLDHSLHIAIPSRQGLAHLREGSIVHFIPFEACVFKFSGELVSFVQLREEEVAQIPSVRMPQVLGVDRDGAPENADGFSPLVDYPKWKV